MVSSTKASSPRPSHNTAMFDLVQTANKRPHKNWLLLFISAFQFTNVYNQTANWGVEGTVWMQSSWGSFFFLLEFLMLLLTDFTYLHLRLRNAITVKLDLYNSFSHWKHFNIKVKASPLVIYVGFAAFMPALGEFDAMEWNLLLFYSLFIC